MTHHWVDLPVPCGTCPEADVSLLSVCVLRVHRIAQKVWLYRALFFVRAFLHVWLAPSVAGGRIVIPPAGFPAGKRSQDPLWSCHRPIGLKEGAPLDPLILLHQGWTVACQNSAGLGQSDRPQPPSCRVEVQQICLSESAVSHSAPCRSYGMVRMKRRGRRFRSCHSRWPP